MVYVKFMGAITGRAYEAGLHKECQRCTHHDVAPTAVDYNS